MRPWRGWRRKKKEKKVPDPEPLGKWKRSELKLLAFAYVKRCGRQQTRLASYIPTRDKIQVRTYLKTHPANAALLERFRQDYVAMRLPCQQKEVAAYTADREAIERYVQQKNAPPTEPDYVPTADEEID